MRVTKMTIRKIEKAILRGCGGESLGAVNGLRNDSFYDELRFSWVMLLERFSARFYLPIFSGLRTDDKIINASFSPNVRGIFIIS
jgi:hypothetical protein